MGHIVIGTAGHIDHGKTTLIRALTGRETDRLREEIRRGISIDLGFTYFDLPSGSRAGIIDVPGHERFIKNMLAGASGIDLVLLAVAANEGIKPQTIEHIDILSYLGIKKALIVLTKATLADEVVQEVVKEDIREATADTFLENAEIITIDSLSGLGLQKLVERIDAIAHEVPPRNTSGPARLNIDRVFSLKGFGTIVTGTLAEGRIRQDDKLTIYPSGLSARIRSIQVHDSTVAEALAGQRTAINIPNIKTDEVSRGDVLATPGSLCEAKYIDVNLGIVRLTRQRLKFWERVRIYTGCREVLARLVPLDAESLGAGESAYCQLRLEESLAVKTGDMFVVRTYSPMDTIGGGVVLEPNAARHSKLNPELLHSLAALEENAPATSLELFVKQNTPISLGEACAALGITDAHAKIFLEQLPGLVIKFEDLLFHTHFVDTQRSCVLGLLEAYHAQYNMRPGMPREELRSRLAKLKRPEFEVFLKLIEYEGFIRLFGNVVAAHGFAPFFNPKQLAIKDRLVSSLLEAGFSPPSLGEVVQNSKLENEVCEALVASGELVRLGNDVLIHARFHKRAQDIVIKHIHQHGELSLAEFRDLTGSSRRYSMLILEDLDNRQITARSENKRTLHENLRRALRAKKHP